MCLPVQFMARARTVKLTDYPLILLELVVVCVIVCKTVQPSGTTLLW